MADDDDDDSFGEFTFASSLNSPKYRHPLPQINILKFPITPAATISTSAPTATAVNVSAKDYDDDDEWGDFVETPHGSAASSHTPSSKPFDPFNFFSSNQSFQSESAKKAGTESTRQVESENTNVSATRWVKLKGAIPLSIFGEFDEEEGEISGVGDSHDNNGKDSRNVDEVNDKLKTSNDFDILENMHFNDQSGFGSSKMNVASLGGRDSVLGLGMLELDFSSIENRKVSDASVELRNGNEKESFENGINSRSKDMTSSLDVLNADFMGWTVVSTRLDSILSSKSDKVSSVHDQYQLNVKDNGGPKSKSNSMDLNLRKEDSVIFDAWDLDFNGFQSNLGTMNSNKKTPSSDRDVQISNSNVGGKSEELRSALDDEAADDDGWEFKDAYGNVQVHEVLELTTQSILGQELQVQSEVQQLSNAKSFSSGFVVASNGSIDLHPLSNMPFGPFSISNGTSSSPGDIFGLHSNAFAASENGFLSDTRLIYEQKSGRSGLDSSKEIGISEADDDFGVFATVLAESEPKPMDELRLHGSADTNMPPSEFVNGANGSISLFTLSNGSADLFSPVNGISNGSNKNDVEFHTEPSVLFKNEAVNDDYTLYPTSRREQVCGEDVHDQHLVVGGTASEDDFGEFTIAPANTSQMQEGVEITRNILSKALPLSVFGEKESENEDSLSIDDFLHQPEHFKKNDNTAYSSVPINDLISKLYNQAEKTSSPRVIPSQSVLTPSESIMNSSLIEGANDIGGTALVNTDSCFEDTAACQSSPVWNGGSDESISPEVKLDSYVDFYSKLNDELSHFFRCQPQSLKEAEGGSIFSDKDAELLTRIQEIQEVGITREYLVDDQERRVSDLDRFVELLQKPELRVFELEYDLKRRLSLVGSDFRSAIELMEHVKTMLRILSLGSMENILTYVSIWPKMINACALELQHGAQIFRESLERNVQSQLLADVRGKKFIFGLCEIYRVVIVIGASAKLYKPWTFLSLESSSMLSRLEECHALWNSLGLEEALLGISVATSLDLEEDTVVLLDSIKYTRDLDAVALQNLVFSKQEPLCRLSLLTPGVAPGIAMVMWDNEQCFVKLANLWANLISSDFPRLLPLRVN